eukprot:CAMPEP_0204841840 /NCGR_PEP_ID=MMETSP1346-20131115/43862_1 /ASSEMBLY_ACC=CAM_ASM_000771 /TAXON_ID=215587 /ORGANISM="Aplanochytrium stocchinoi, Strain GSBS06" /LENGTH=99 /DNA_ID=CAMNT_0051980281 /DNA_START=68 /DNA_END=364 /DNA_ORIENTATION=-
METHVSFEEVSSAVRGEKEKDDFSSALKNEEVSVTSATALSKSEPKDFFESDDKAADNHDVKENNIAASVEAEEPQHEQELQQPPQWLLSALFFLKHFF